MTALGECAWTDRALVGPAVLGEEESMLPSVRVAPELGGPEASALSGSCLGHGASRSSSASTAWFVLSERLPDGRWMECERPGSLPDGAHLLAPDFAWEYEGGELVRCWISSAEAERQGRLASEEGRDEGVAGR